MRFFRFFQYLNHRILWQLVQSVMQRRLPGLAAEMAYSNTLAIFPAMIGLVTIIGTLKIAPNLNSITEQWLQVAPPDVVSLISSFLQQVQIPNSGQVLSLSLGITVWIASGAIGVAMAAMDQIHQTPLRLRRPFWKARLIAILLTIGTAAALVGASFLIVISDLLVRFLDTYVTIPQFEVWRELANVRWLIAFALLITGFSVLYRFGPSQWPVGMPLLPGAVTAALLWALVSLGFRIYLAYFGSRLNLTYGALSAGISLLLWLNLSSLALLIGAQLNVTVGEAMVAAKR
jgi:membrane protein